MNQFQHVPQCLAQLPLRARLKRTGITSSSPSVPAWVVVDEWLSDDSRPALADLSLHLIKVNGSDCCAVIALGAASLQTGPSEDERALVYLLSPADEAVWEAIDSWLEKGFITVEFRPRQLAAHAIEEVPAAILAMRCTLGEERQSDSLAAALADLIGKGALDDAVSKQLQLPLPIYCAVIETEMLYSSFMRLDDTEMPQRRFVEQEGRLREGIAS